MISPRRGVKEAATGCPEVIDGYFSLPNGPGLGMELNEDLIAEHPYPRRFIQPLGRRLA